MTKEPITASLGPHESTDLIDDGVMWGPLENVRVSVTNTVGELSQEFVVTVDKLTSIEQLKAVAVMLDKLAYPERSEARFAEYEKALRQDKSNV